MLYRTSGVLGGFLRFHVFSALCSRWEGMGPISHKKIGSTPKHLNAVGHLLAHDNRNLFRQLGSGGVSMSGDVYIFLDQNAISSNDVKQTERFVCSREMIWAPIFYLSLNQKCVRPKTIRVEWANLTAMHFGQERHVLRGISGIKPMQSIVIALLTSKLVVRRL